MTAILAAPRPVREHRRPLPDWPFVSIIVPVRNEEQHLPATLRCLTAQDYPSDRYEVLICDGVSEDATPVIARAFAEAYPELVRVVNNPRRLSSAARNLGVRQAQGDILLIVDGHCQIRDPEYLSKLVEAFQRHDPDCVGRPQPLEVEHATPLQQAIAAVRRSPVGHNPDSYIYSSQGRFVRPQSVAIAYRREVFHRIGLFDERFDACEDVEFNYRADCANLTCYFEPRVGIPYVPRDSLGRLIYQMRRYGRGRAMLAAKHPASLSLPILAPMNLFVWLTMTALVGLFWPWAAGAFCVSVLAYSLAVLVSSAHLARQIATPRVWLWLPLVTTAIHLGFAWGMLTGFAAVIRSKLTHHS